MSACGNIDVIVAHDLADWPGTISARLAALRDRTPSRALSEDDEVPLQGLIASSFPADGPQIGLVASGNPGADYLEVSVSVQSGVSVHGRLIVPATGGSPEAGERRPLVLMFHDAGRPARGWHHMARFAALGCAVLALDGGVVAPERAAGEMEGLAVRAFALAQAGFALQCVDAARVCTWGEGLGGALAVLVAGAFPSRVAKCAALNPFPVDDMRLPVHVDAACVASRLRCELLVGTALLDELAPPEAQAALAAAAGGPVRQLFYPKHAHERINDFENELLQFLHFD